MKCTMTLLYALKLVFTNFGNILATFLIVSIIIYEIHNTKTFYFIKFLGSITTNAIKLYAFGYRRS